MNKTTLITNIRTAVQRNRIKQALTLLKKLTQQYQHPNWKNTATALSSRFSSLKQQEINGVLNFNEANQEKNKITHAILNLLDMIETGEESAAGGFDNSESSTIRQEHRGSGDNVAGNKTVNYNSTPPANSGNASSNELGFTTSKAWKWFLIVVLICGFIASLVKIFGYDFSDFFASQPKTTSNVTIKARPAGNYELPKKGEIILNFGGEIISKKIGSQGEVYFPEISNDYFDEDSKVRIAFNDPDNEPFQAVYEDSLYQLASNSTIDLWVELTGLDKMYGIVKDFKTGNVIEGVRVSILNLDTLTNENGWFELKIPVEKQRKFHKIRMAKAGYETYEKDSIPPQTEKEIEVLLKPKNYQKSKTSSKLTIDKNSNNKKIKSLKIKLEKVQQEYEAGRIDVSRYIDLKAGIETDLESLQANQ